MAHCENCGCELREDAAFCHKCGKPTDNDAARHKDGHTPQNPPKRCSSGSSKNNRSDRDEERSAGRTAVIVLLCVLIALMLLVAASVASYMFMNRSSAMRDSMNERFELSTVIPATPEPSPTPAQSASKPKYTLSPAQSDIHVENPRYSVYSDPDYNFSCAYPSHFEKYIDNTASGRYTLKTGDGKATLRICAEKNDAGITIPQALSMYTSKTGGEIEFSRTGSTYYTVRINSDGVCKYRYFVNKGSNSYWFELNYPEEYKYIYEEYEQHIYTSFKIN